MNDTELLARIRELLGNAPQEVITQDNAITNLPVFTVEQQRRRYGVESEYTEEFVWLDSDYEEVQGEQVKELDAYYDAHGYEPDGYARVGYVDDWEFVTACFTRAGCEAYLRADGHNLKAPRIYVHSGYRNREWEAMRAVLGLLAGQEPRD